MAKGKKSSKILIVELKEFVLHRTKRTKLHDDKGNLARDLKHHTMTITDILENPLVKAHMELLLIGPIINKMIPVEKAFSDKFIRTTKTVLELDFQSLIYTACIGELFPTANKILRAYKYSQSTANSFDVFKSLELSNIIKNHKRTLERIKYIKEEFDSFLKKNFEGFKNDKNYFEKIRLENKDNSNLLEEEIKKIMKKYPNDDNKIRTNEELHMKKNINLTYFNYFFQTTGSLPNFNEISGLAVLIGSLWAYEINISKLKIYDDRSFDYNLDLVFYDHFSLDPSDVIPNSEQDKLKKLGITIVSSFSSWYVLQFLDKFKGSYSPIITTLEFSYSKFELENILKKERF